MPAPAQGPPGTGKTAMLGPLCCYLANTGNRVLVTAPSNVAVFNIADRCALRACKFPCYCTPEREQVRSASHSRSTTYSVCCVSGANRGCNALRRLQAMLGRALTIAWPASAFLPQQRGDACSCLHCPDIHTMSALRRTSAYLRSQFATYVKRSGIVGYPPPCNPCNPGDLVFVVSCCLHACTMQRSGSAPDAEAALTPDVYWTCVTLM